MGDRKYVKRKYMAENIETGEILEGGSKFFKEKLGIDSNHIYTCAERESIYNQKWKITYHPDSEDDFPTESQCERWDKMRKSFLNKPKSGFRKPQEIDR